MATILDEPRESTHAPAGPPRGLLDAETVVQLLATYGNGRAVFDALCVARGDLYIQGLKYRDLYDDGAKERQARRERTIEALMDAMAVELSGINDPF